MRLAVVSPFLDRQHGTELCIIEQIERFAGRDHWQVELYSQRVEQVEGLGSGAAYSRDVEGAIVWHKVSEIPGPHLLKYLWWFFANQWQRRRDRRSGRVRPDLVYSPGINCLDADVIVVHIVFHAFYERVKSELALHRVPLPSWPRVIHRKLYYQLSMLLERKVYRNPGVRLVAVSALVARQLETFFGDKRIVVIPNAVDTKRFRPEARLARRAEFRETFHFADDDFVILLIGNDWKKKGLDSLLRAAAQLPDLPVRLLVVGADDTGIYRSRIEELGLQPRIRFERPSPDVLRFYAAADLYVGPSLEDAFNLPILESMACGLPVIASAQAGASEFVRDGENGLILNEPLDHTMIAQQIRRLFQNKTFRVRMGETAAQFVQANCSWDQNAAKTREILMTTCKGRRED